jgi:glycine cleavage system H protein
VSDVPNNLKFTESHEWVLDNGDGTITVGITDFAQTLLGDLVYVELPDVGDVIEREEECAVVDSVKATSDIYCPVAGQITETNHRLEADPSLVNSEPYGKGWLFTLSVDNASELDALLSAEDYQKQVAEESH